MSERKRPNVVIILADDLGIEHVGCYGNPVIKTPHIDSIAKDGLRFTRAFTTTAMCAPSRSALYTGLYPHRNGAHQNHSKVKEGTQSLPHYLKPLGYRVGLAGKTHIGPKEAFPFEYMRDDGRDMSTFMAKNGPFCLVIATDEPHAPHPKETPCKPADMIVPKHHVDCGATRNLMTRYYASIADLDRKVGQIRKLLKEKKLADNTLLIFASDHGFNLYAKWSCYEAGLHVPMMAVWPGKTKAAATTDAMVSFVDLVPTLVELADGDANKLKVDGKSFADVLTGKADTHHEYIYGAHSNLGIHHGGPYPIRSVREERYKYIRNLHPEGEFKCIVTHERDGSLKDKGLFAAWQEKAKTDKHAKARVEHLLKRPAEELYDLQNDPHELNNLADKEELRNTKLKLKARLHQWMEKQGDPGLRAEMSEKEIEKLQRN